MSLGIDYSKDNEPRREFSLSDVKGMTLLSEKDVQECKDYIRGAEFPDDCDWWLKTPGTWDYTTMKIVLGKDAAVQEDSIIQTGVRVESPRGVRPALMLTEAADFKAGDRASLFGENWTVISEELALCDRPIRKMPYVAKDFPYDGRTDVTDYEKSDVKQFVDDWYQRQRDLAAALYYMEHPDKAPDELYEASPSEKQMHERADDARFDIPEHLKSSDEMANDALKGYGE